MLDSERIECTSAVTFDETISTPMELEFPIESEQEEASHLALSDVEAKDNAGNIIPLSQSALQCRDSVKSIITDEIPAQNGPDCNDNHQEAVQVTKQARKKEIEFIDTDLEDESRLIVPCGFMQAPDTDQDQNRRSQQVIKRPEQHTRFVHAAEPFDHRTQAFIALRICCFVDRLNQDPLEPTTYQQAVASQAAKKWTAAMNDEYNSLVKKNTWTKGKSANSSHILKVKWVYKLKRDKTGDIERYKARWVIKGYEQLYDCNYK